MSFEQGNISPRLTGATKVALSVQFIKYLNSILNEEIVVSRLVNQQVFDFNELCEYLADGSTVTAADVAAVMKQIEMRIPLVLGLNAKVVCSPEGLTFRPTVSGSLTQSQLKKKLEAKLLADPSADIDVNRAITVSDLTTSDLTASIAIDLPKVWIERFKSKATFKRITKGNADISETSEESETSGGTTGSGSDGTGGSSAGPSTSSGTGSETAVVASPTINGETPFDESTQVTMSGPEGAEIRYTTDGTAPSAESSLYSEAITLSDTTTVKAIAIKGGVSSEAATKVFTKNGSNVGSGGFETGA